MQKKLSLALLALLLAPMFPVVAAVNVVAQPVSLVTSPVTLAASSAPLGLIKFSLGADAGETLSSVAITVSNVGLSNATSADIANVTVYRDAGNGTFDTATDLVAGTQATVNAGSATTITTSANNTLPATFFVSLATSANWSDVAPADSISVALATNGIVTSANSPTVTAVTTNTITADTTGPLLQTAVAQNTGSTAAKTAGDSVILTFNEATNKPVLGSAQIPTVLTLNNGHTWLDGTGSVISSVWNEAGTALTITLNQVNGLPTIEPGDTVTIAGAVIKDAVGNNATGNTTITGSFINDVVGPQLTLAKAYNTGGTAAVEAGDSVQLIFSEITNKPTITKDNINTTLTLNNSHTWLDSAGNLGTAVWNTDGTKLTITLSANAGSGVTPPTVVVGDTVTIAGSLIKDATNNNATGSMVITGSFGAVTPQPGTGKGGVCLNGLKNGWLYKISDNDNVIYLAAACKLKVWKGRDHQKRHGLKFRNVITLSSIESITIKPLRAAVWEDLHQDRVREHEWFNRIGSDKVKGKSEENKGKGKGKD